MEFSWDLVINAIVTGVVLGGFYASVAIGVTIAFGMLDIVNIAHPAFMIAGAYLAFWGGKNLASTHSSRSLCSRHAAIFSDEHSIVPIIFSSSVAATSRCKDWHSFSAFSLSSKSASFWCSGWTTVR